MFSTPLPIFSAAAALVLALVSTHSSAADDLAVLYRRKADLESQLQSLNERIATLQSAPAASVVSTAPPKYFVKDFGIDSVNSAGGVEPYLVLFNPNPATPIKYLVAEVTLYNAVGDRISSYTESRQASSPS